MFKIIVKSHVIVNALRVFYSPVKLVKKWDTDGKMKWFYYNGVSSFASVL